MPLRIRTFQVQLLTDAPLFKSLHHWIGGRCHLAFWLVQPNKGWEQVVDVKGAPIRWHPDYSTSADRKRRDDAAAAEIEKARTLRREQGEREQMVPDPRRYRTGP